MSVPLSVFLRKVKLLSTIYSREISVLRNSTTCCFVRQYMFCFVVVAKLHKLATVDLCWPPKKVFQITLIVSFQFLETS